MAGLQALPGIQALRHKWVRLTVYAGLFNAVETAVDVLVTHNWVKYGNQHTVVDSLLIGPGTYLTVAYAVGILVNTFFLFTNSLETEGRPSGSLGAIKRSAHDWRVQLAGFGIALLSVALSLPYVYATTRFSLAVIAPLTFTALVYNVIYELWIERHVIRLYQRLWKRERRPVIVPFTVTSIAPPALLIIAGVFLSGLRNWSGFTLNFEAILYVAGASQFFTMIRDVSKKYILGSDVCDGSTLHYWRTVWSAVIAFICLVPALFSPARWPRVEHAWADLGWAAWLVVLLLAARLIMLNRSENYKNYALAPGRGSVTTVSMLTSVEVIGAFIVSLLALWVHPGALGPVTYDTRVWVVRGLAAGMVFCGAWLLTIIQQRNSTQAT